MMYAVEMCSGAVIYLPSFIKIGSGIQKLTGDDTQTHRSNKPTCVYFFLNKGSRRRMQHGYLWIGGLR
jgi:hypothetical protein